MFIFLDNMKLALLHPHPRDSSITFQEEGHIYTIDGFDKHPTSVTTFIGKFWKKFDPESKSLAIVESGKVHDPRNRYFGKNQQQIMDEWNEIRLKASSLGTEMHLSFELYLNDDLKEYPSTKEFGMFLQFIRDFDELFPGCKPYRTEWVIYTPDGKYAGSIDAVLINEKGELIIIDWKRSPYSKLFSVFGNARGLPPVSHLKDNKYNHYSLQVNTYCHFLETYYGFRVVGMYLGLFHPDFDEYYLVNVNRMENEIHKMLEHDS